MTCEEIKQSAKNALSAMGSPGGLLGGYGHDQLKTAAIKLNENYVSGISKESALLAANIVDNIEKIKTESTKIAKGEFAQRVFEATEIIRLGAGNDPVAVRDAAKEVQLLVQYVYCENLEAYSIEAEKLAVVQAGRNKQLEKEKKESQKMLLWIIGGIVGVLTLAGILFFFLRGK